MPTTDDRRAEPPSSRAMRPSRRSGIAPFIVMEILAAANARAATGADVIHLEVGEPGGGPPAMVLDAARAALDRPGLGYTEALGLPALRRRIAEHYRRRHGVDVPIERIVVTNGASGAFILAFLAAFDAGDRVAIGEPGYPAYRNILQALDVEVVPIATDLSTRFQPTTAHLDELNEPIRGLIVASPANPTGTTLDATSLAALGAWCRDRSAWLIADEIYQGITYEAPASSILESSSEAIVVNSFSKYFCMTGWRLGWLVLPLALIEPVTRLAQNLFISPPAISQHAALAAFDATDELKARIARYRRNRDRLRAALLRAEVVELAPADGAFYLYAEISPFGLDSPDLCRAVLAETGVAITPGVDFDPRRGQHWVRLSFAGDETGVTEAARRLEAWLGARRRAS